MADKSKDFVPLSDLVLATQGSVATLSNDVLLTLSEQALAHKMRKARILLHGKVMCVMVVRITLEMDVRRR